MLKIIKKYSFVIGLTILVVIVWQSDLSQLLKIVSKINWWYVLIAYLLDFPEVLSKAFLWRLIMKKQGINYSLKKTFSMYMSGMAMGFFTPGKIGDFSRFLYLKRDGVRPGRALANVVVERLAAALYLLIAGYCGCLFLVQNFWTKTSYVFMITMAAVLFLMVIIKLGWHKKLINKAISFLLPAKLLPHWQEFWQEIKTYSLKNFSTYILLTAIPWIIYYFEFYFLAKSVGLNEVPFIYLSAAITVSFFFTFLPISYLGIGTRELALIIFLSPFGTSRETVIILSQLALVDSFWTALTGLFFWLKNPIPLEELKK